MYPVRDKHRTERARLFSLYGRVAGRTPVWFVWVLALLLLTGTGIVYRAVASRLERIAKSVTLPVSLDAFPKEIGHWVGDNVPIPANIQRVAGNDAFVNRLYRNRVSNEWVNVYVAYSAHPRTMLGHRPRICYVAGGWIHDGTEQTHFTSRGGKELGCLVHRFHRPAPEHEETVVLNFYVVNGRTTWDDSVFTGVGWRTPNIDGDLARYVTQVQISSTLENSVRSAASDMTELILDFFPDEDGRVRAVEYVEPSRGGEK